MATRQVFIDDLDGSEDGVETVRFGLDGYHYSIDLGHENQKRLRELLGEFIAVAALVDERGNPKRGPRAGNRKAVARQEIKVETADVPKPAELPKFDTKIARAWLRENNFEVPDRGKLRAEVVQPYLDSMAFDQWRQENL